MNKKITILVVDDHALFRSGVISLLERDDRFVLSGEAGDALEGIKLARKLRPDVILMDLNIPGFSGLDALRVVAKEAPFSRVIVLTVSENGDDLVEAIRSGAAGYLLKNIEIDELFNSIVKVTSGDLIVSQYMTPMLVEGVRTPTVKMRKPNESGNLSPREREILIWLAKGETNKEIGLRLDLAEGTIKVHVKSIFRKLNFKTRVQAAVYALEHGYEIPESIDKKMVVTAKLT